MSFSTSTERIFHKTTIWSMGQESREMECGSMKSTTKKDGGDRGERGVHSEIHNEDESVSWKGGRETCPTSECQSESE